jgi:hypothetical protein
MLARTLASLILLGINAALFGALLVFFIFRPTIIAAPWDGPALATVSLAAATITLAAVAGGIGLLAVWGYSTLREHAANVASNVAAKEANEAADRKVQQLLKEWGLSEEAGSEAVAKAYEQEQPIQHD